MAPSTSSPQFRANEIALGHVNGRQEETIMDDVCRTAEVLAAGTLLENYWLIDDKYDKVYDADANYPNDIGDFQ